MLGSFGTAKETGLLDREVHEAASTNVGIAAGEAAESHETAA